MSVTTEGTNATLAVTAEEYRAHLADTSCAFEFRAFASAGSEFWAQCVQVVLVAPELEVTGPTDGIGAGPQEYVVKFTNPCAFGLGKAELQTTTRRGVTVSIQSGQGQDVGPGATVDFVLSLSRSEALAGKTAVLGLELDTDVLTDLPGELALSFA